MYYDKNAKTLGTLKENQAVRIPATKGYDKLGGVNPRGKNHDLI